jgi:glycosyltransferase involved in cell wall biosynthesis
MIKSDVFKVLMVSTEYPPMHGGVGRHTANLTRELRKRGLTVIVACNEEGDGDYSGLAPANDHNSEVLLEIVKQTSPDIVHVQYEHGLYGLILDPVNPRNTRTNIDLFFEKCSVPIVTTFHTSFTFKQWMNMVVPIKNRKIFGGTGIYRNRLLRYWTHFVNYKSFNDLNTKKLKKSKEGIVFSQYMKEKVGGGRIIYHGAESGAPYPSTKEIARQRFSLPVAGRIALAVGFKTATKGWDLFRKMVVPENWTVVINSSRNHYNVENFDPRFEGRKKIVNLDMDFLNEAELSLLFYAADAVILPYKVSSGSGVMFDGLAHGLPFVASDLGFFKEFSNLGLGIAIPRNPNAFANALVQLSENYQYYRNNVKAFKDKISWDNVARMHAEVYVKVVTNTVPHQLHKSKPSTGD